MEILISLLKESKTGQVKGMGGGVQRRGGEGRVERWEVIFWLNPERF